ncbi:endonuclease/exonuclease/phosphatase family protein [Nitrosomonas sp.]|uniref:endonuclease/exonuclease/phosphatase family protein n=1 Tax=Nitrosomonas sp. TaxID=42353 RepID=UPI001D70F460|nr:endonuclease/exonuclease/phosphatase family protein [Nitrosomonas sp.]MBX3617731.1 endonuclease/exonuclease/phosphatase family protein [Nitrosomonas sp.]
MKIVSWNCNGALRKKLDILSVLDPDICIIQECEDPTRCSDVSYRKWAQNYLWIGSNKNRGLGVFVKPDVSLERVNLDPGPLEFFLPCIVANRISLLAAWTRQANSPTFRYIGQLWKYLQRHQSFLVQPESILIGDLNSNTCWDVWDRWWNHSDVVRLLQEIGLKSLYHHERGENQGMENTPTFFMYRRSDKSYHIDYAFLSETLLERASLEVGIFTHWIEHSDHMPIIVHIADDIEPKGNRC